MTLRPAQVHPHQFLSEVRCVNTTRLGTDRDQGVSGVVFARQERADLKCLDLLSKPVKFTPHLGLCIGIVLFHSELKHHGGVVEAVPQTLKAFHLSLANR